jgi:hypothetical protein
MERERVPHCHAKQHVSWEAFGAFDDESHAATMRRSTIDFWSVAIPGVGQVG